MPRKPNLPDKHVTRFVDSAIGHLFGLTRFFARLFNILTSKNPRVGRAGILSGARSWDRP